MSKFKNVVLFVAMVSLGASAFTSLAGFQNTAFEYNAYFQGAIAVALFLWLVHKAISATEVRVKPITNARDKKG